MLRFLLLLLLASCGGGGDMPVNASQAQARRLEIVVIGDSIAAGYMPTAATQEELRQELSFPVLLRSSANVYTAAVGGATTADALRNQTMWLGDIRADVVVVMLGTNDAAFKLDAAQSLANVRAIADKWPTARLILVSPPRWADYTDAWLTDWSKRLAQLAQERGAVFVDVYAASVPDWQCHPVNHHPCANAHREIARLILKTL